MKIGYHALQILRNVCAIVTDEFWAVEQIDAWNGEKWMTCSLEELVCSGSCSVECSV